MSNSAKKEYLLEVRKRYFSASKSEKSIILQEFCKVCKYNRKYAIRLINKKESKISKRKKPGRPSKYDRPEIVKFLKDLWIATNLAYSVCLKAAIAIWIPFYHLHYSNSLFKEQTYLLLKISLEQSIGF